jgi:hypothetical protein
MLTMPMMVILHNDDDDDDDHTYCINPFFTAIIGVIGVGATSELCMGRPIYGQPLPELRALSLDARSRVCIRGGNVEERLRTRRGTQSPGQDNAQ